MALNIPQHVTQNIQPWNNRLSWELTFEMELFRIAKIHISYLKERLWYPYKHKYNSKQKNNVKTLWKLSPLPENYHLNLRLSSPWTESSSQFQLIAWLSLQLHSVGSLSTLS